MEDKEGDKEEMEEGRNNPRTTNADKFAGHEDRYHADRIHEEDEKELDESSCGTHRKRNESLQEAIRKIAKAKRVFLGNKRIK